MTLPDLVGTNFPGEPLPGRLVTLRSPPGCWKGPPPEPGEWLGAEGGRVSYEVVAAWGSPSGAVVIRCRRYRRGDEHVVGHRWFHWRWLPRRGSR